MPRIRSFQCWLYCLLCVLCASVVHCFSGSKSRLPPCPAYYSLVYLPKRASSTYWLFVVARHHAPAFLAAWPDEKSAKYSVFHKSKRSLVMQRFLLANVRDSVRWVLGMATQVLQEKGVRKMSA